MGDSWRIGVDPAERTVLVTGGPFAVVRNPIFTAFLAGCAGLTLMSGNVVALLGLAAVLAAVEGQVRVVEEPYLRRTHPEQYGAYAARVGGSFPGSAGCATSAPNDTPATAKLVRQIHVRPAEYVWHGAWMHIARDATSWTVTSGGQQWDIAWFPPPVPPAGTPHGSAAICFTGGKVVLISSDGQLWGFPGGRPEQGEDWLDVLKREVHEEACAVVTSQRLLGFSRGVCTAGRDAGLVLVRAWWAATVELLPWQPLHEIAHRKLVAPQDIHASIWMEDGYEPLYRRILHEADISLGED